MGRRDSMNSWEPLPKWSEIYKLIDHSWVRAVDRFVQQTDAAWYLTFIHDTSAQLYWSDVEDIASRYLTEPRVLALAAIYWSDWTFYRENDRVKITTREPPWLTHLLSSGRVLQDEASSGEQRATKKSAKKAKKKAKGARNLVARALK